MPRVAARRPGIGVTADGRCGRLRRVRRIVLVVMLVAAPPAAAGQFPTPSVAGGDERLAAERKALEERTYGETTGVHYTFCAAFVRGLTLGVSEVIMRHVDDGFPVLADASKINPRASMAGTALGLLVLLGIVATYVYPPLLRALRRRRIAREGTADRFDEPVEREEIVGSFVTRDGYEFVVTRSPRTVRALRTELRPDQPEVDGLLDTNKLVN